MAYINGNKPIVTDGLIYALDFGNTRSYNSGSTTAKSLAYDQATTSVSGSPVLTDGILDFTSTKFVKRDGSLPALDPNGTFTVMIVGKSTAEGTLLHQDTLNATINSTSSLFGFGVDNGDFSRSYPGFTSSSLQHVTYRYSQGTVDTFINGIPVTASAANSALTTTAVSNALFLGDTAGGFEGSVAQFYVYNRALSADEIYQTYLVSAEKNGLPTIPKPYTQDENLYKYLQTTGITDATTISAVNTFISDLKSNGLWNKMTAIYPFLTTATGSQAVNLKDPGVLAVDYSGSYTASSTGPVPATATDYIDLTGIKPTYAYPGINSGSSHFTALSYDPQSQVGFLGGTSLPALGGEIIARSGSKVYHAFTTVGTSSFIPLTNAISNVEVLVVAGGGGGGKGNNNNYGGGGGGAGGLVLSSSYTITPGTPYEVVVGAGGAGSLVFGKGLNGDNSYFGTVVAIGGGGGGEGGNNNTDGGTGSFGGSGGGGGGKVTAPPANSGSGIIGQGKDGGLGGLNVFGGSGGGGGGATTTGSAPTNFQTGGAGGAGLVLSMTGELVEYARGGTGGYAQINSIEPPGTPNTGNGGNGTRFGVAGNGGSGIVIVGYDVSSITAITGSGTGLYITEDAITGSVNNGFTAGITGSGTIGFLTVSRTGSNSYSLRKNNQQAVINLAATASLTTDFFLGGANLGGGPNLNLPARIAYASVGAGLTDSEVSTYYNLVSQFQTNLKRQNTLLDNYSGAAAAYSLRRIGPSGYFGPAIRVRRDSDNALRDIGFTSDGQLDTVGLLDFVGVTGSGFVQTWYDQSGNGKNATQATAGSQPLVLSSGSLIVQGVNPSLRFATTNLNSDGKRLTNTQIGLSQGDTIFAYGSRTSTDDRQVLVDSETVSFGDLGVGTTVYLGAGTVLTYGNAFTGNQLHYGYYNGSQTQAAINGATATIGNAGTDNGTNLHIGSTTISSRYHWIGSINEVLIYNTDQSSNRTAIESNINTNYKIYGDATASFDPDYQAFITATGITEPTQSAALETLVSDLKSYGLWDKMKAVYPMVTDKNNRVGHSEDFTNGKWNYSGSTQQTVAVTAPDGTANSNLILDTVDTGDHYFYETINGDGVISGSEYVASFYGKFYNQQYIAMDTNCGATAWFDIQNGATGSYTGSNATITDVGSGWYRCALYFTSSEATGAKNYQIHLADTDNNFSYTGTGLSGSYVWGAQFENGNLLGPYRQTNGDVFDTGDMLDQMKFNLVNPEDSDAAHRIQYSGSWNPGYFGSRPAVGNTNYASTNLIPSSSLTFANAHFSWYAPVPIKAVGGAEGIGAVSDSFVNGLDTTNYQGTTSYSIGTRSINVSQSTGATTKGFAVVTRTSTTSLKAFKNNALIGVNNTENTGSLPSVPFYIGSVNFNGNQTVGNNTNTNFVTIGDGLTDYEAKALYWIVQKFQTTLGRQVY